MKTHCFDYIKQLLPDFANNAEKIDKIKSDIKKLGDKHEAIKSYTDSILKEEMEKSAKKLEDRIGNYQKTQNLKTKIDALIKGTFEKDIFGRVKKRDFATALKHLIYQNGSYDLITKQRTFKNKALTNFYNQLTAVDKDLTTMMFGQNPKQMWEAINILPVEKKGKVAILNISNDLRRIANILNSKDPSKLKYKLSDFNPKLVQYAKVLNKDLDPLLEYMGIRKLDGHAGIQKYDQDIIRNLSEKQFSDKIIDEYGVDYGKMFDGTVKEGSLILDKDGKFQSVVIIDRELNIEKTKSITQIEKDIKLRNEKGGITQTEEKFKNEVARAFEAQRTFKNKVALEKLITREHLEQELWYIKEEIQNGGIHDSIFSRGENLQKKRVIRLKDVDAEIRMNEDWNNGENIVLQYRDALTKLTEKKFIFDELGTNPLETINTLVQDYRKSTVGKGGTKEKELPFQIRNDRIINNARATEHVGHYIEALLHSSSYGFETNKKLATGLKLARAWTSLEVLSKVAVSYTADVHNVLFSQALQGKKIFSSNTISAMTQRFKDNIVGLVHAPFTATGIGKSGRSKAFDMLEGRMQDSLGRDLKSVQIASNRLNNNINRYLSDTITGVKTVDALQNMLFSSTQMIDTLQKLSARDMISANLIEDIGLKMSELPKARQFYYEKYGIGEKEWDIARKYMVLERGELEIKEGMKIKDADIIPELAMNLDDSIIKDLAKGDILAEGKITEKSLNKAREELRDKFDILYNRTISQMMGEDRTGAELFFKRGTKAGTVSGELARGFGQLQTYSLGFYRNMFLGVLNHPVYSAGQKLGMLAGFTTVGALGGTLPYKIIKSVLSGKKPESLIDDGDGNFNWKMLIGLYEYSGAFTIYGEYAMKLYGESQKSNTVYSKGARWERAVQSTLGATVGGAIVGGFNIYDAIKNGKVDRDYVAQFITSNTPNINPLQPILMALMNMNFFLSDEKVDRIKSNAESRNQPYFIPTK